MIVVERSLVDKPDRLFSDDIPNLVEPLFDAPTRARCHRACGFAVTGAGSPGVWYGGLE